MDGLKAQLDRIEKSTGRTERAVFGEEESGLPGLVNDMATMKEFREKQNLRSAWIAGAVASAVVAAKAIYAKLFGP